ncbi:MAG: response regulator [Archangiaceae bacterium]|nr:response regulator [Archangiaceae bacterium]
MTTDLDPPAAPQPKRTVLVVDDEPGIRSVMKRLLGRYGYEVFVAAGGEEGLTLLREHPVQLVISDIDMPQMNGLQFLTLVHDRHPRVCRILLTGRADLDSAKKAINEGEVYRFLEKPVSNEHLLSTLHFAFETLELEEANRRLVDELKSTVKTLHRLRAAERAQAQELELQRGRAETLLLNVLPRSIAERLKAGEKTLADRFPEATVLFSDLVDFTTLSASMTPQEVVALLNELFSRFDQLADGLGVEKIKTLGDGYLAAAGLPDPRPDHARAVADLALEMQRELERLNERRGTRLQMRIGVHSGPVVAGIIGLHRFSYDLWGDTVNTAARLESTGAPGRIHVSAEAQRALEQTHRLEPRGPVAMKGKGELDTFWLTGKK